MPTASVESALRLIRRVNVAALMLLFLSLSVQKIWNVDPWCILRIGHWVIENGGFPSHDAFSYTVSDHEWIELRWLFSAAAYFIWRAGGASGLILMQTALLAVTFVVLAWPAWHGRLARGGGLTWLDVLTLALGLGAACSRFVVRPELVTYLGVVVFLLILTRAEQGGAKRSLWLLPAIQVIWTNAHTVFILGPIIAWLWAGWSVLRALADRHAGDAASNETTARGGHVRRFLLVALFVTAACLINPYGLRGAMFPFHLFGEMQGSDLLGKTIEEFRSPFSVAPWTTWSTDLRLAAVLVVWSALLFVLNFRRLHPARAALWAATLYLACVAVRNVTLFAFVATWTSLMNLRDMMDAPREARKSGGMTAVLLGHTRARLAAHLALTAGLLFSAWYVASDRFSIRNGAPRRFGLGVVEWTTPAAATNFILTAGAAPQLFHSMADGQYLTWAARDRFPVFIDGRIEVYGEPFIHDYYRLPSRRDWEAVFDRLGVNTAMIHREHLAPLVGEMMNSPAWALVHLDDRELVFVRDIPEHADLIRRHRIDPLAPWSPRGPEPNEAPAGWRRWIAAAEIPWYSLGMAKTFLLLGAVDNAAVYLERALAQFPAHSETRLLSATIYRSRHRIDEADRLLAGMTIRPEDAAWADRLLGEIFMRRNEVSDAIKAYERAVRATPNDAAAHAELGAARLAAGDVARAALSFQTASRLDPREAEHAVRLGVALQRLGQMDDAVEAYQHALRCDPWRYEIYNQLGILYARRGDRWNAATYFETALKINPDYEAARANLERLRAEE
jgi:cytochrome c-type biogenesis protein CcmH/NrfG